MSEQPVMVARVEAAQATLDRFKDAPFRYGVRDCVRMVAMHLRKLGYRVRLPASGSYRSYRSALRQLRARGYDSLAAAMDDIGLERIAPSEAIVGDILQLPGDDAIGALGVAMGNGRALGYHQDAIGAVVVQPLEITAAWRVEPAWPSS
jgi:hypothetical protein